MIAGLGLGVVVASAVVGPVVLAARSRVSAAEQRAADLERQLKAERAAAIAGVFELRRATAVLERQIAETERRFGERYGETPGDGA